MPHQYANASRDLETFLVDARDELDLATTHMAYTTVQAVLTVFRGRLTLEQAIAFAGVLPAVLRAIFVADWDPTEERRPFGDRAAMDAEVKQLRRHHNFSPDNSIRRVARTLRRHVDQQQLDRVLTGISPEALEYWSAS